MGSQSTYKTINIGRNIILWVYRMLLGVDKLKIYMSGHGGALSWLLKGRTLGCLNMQAWNLLDLTLSVDAQRR